MLSGLGGNILASIGTQGVLIVDTQFPDLVPKYFKTIGELGGDKVDVAINTHWHYRDARYGDPTRIVNRGYAALTRNRRQPLVARDVIL